MSLRFNHALAQCSKCMQVRSAHPVAHSTASPGGPLTINLYFAEIERPIHDRPMQFWILLNPHPSSDCRRATYCLFRKTIQSSAFSSIHKHQRTIEPKSPVVISIQNLNAVDGKGDSCQHECSEAP